MRKKKVYVVIKSESGSVNTSSSIAYVKYDKAKEEFNKAVNLWKKFSRDSRCFEEEKEDFYFLSDYTNHEEVEIKLVELEVVK